MATCFTIFMIIFFIATLLKTLHYHLTRKIKLQLPPGPLKIPFIGNLLWLRKSFPQMKAIVPTLRAKYGPIYTLHIGSKPFIFIASNSLAHQALIVKGAIFADRPPAIPTDKFLTSDQHNINWAFYGPTWLLLRRNLTSNILQPARIRSFACARKWVLDVLINRLKSQSLSNDHIEVIEHIQHALFCLLAFMCFGDRFEERQIQDIKDVQRRLQLSLDNFKMLNLFPNLGKVFFYKRWEKLRQLRKDQENVMVPFIRARKAIKEGKNKEYYNEPFVPYVNTLFDLQLPEEKRKLEEAEIVTLCSEFVTAGTDTTSTALQWVLGCLIKYPQIQEKLFVEIKGVIGGREPEVKEDDLPKMPYLKAVVLEGLRRHPPSHYLVPHAVTEDVELAGFLVPKNSIVSFMVAEIGRDPKIWENPMAFKPERFLNGEDGEAFDITGSREIKMMPFGAGRRMCPGYGLALLHLEYFVANLIWNFKWVAAGLKRNDHVDLTEKHEFTTVMKNSLKVRITPRSHFG
ncbi:hypothetical protein PTKIN_Ptkin01aG0294500 [Pterospermum kingtungense]